MIRAILDYGCMVYGSAAKSQLEKLEKIQSQALRVCCGAYPSSPISALQVEMGGNAGSSKKKKTTDFDVLG